MSGKVLRLADRAEALAEQARKWEEKHPPITRISVKEADAKRIINTESDPKFVICDLPCRGQNIPRDYDHHNWDDPEIPFGCNLAPGKICITREYTNKSIER